MNLVALGRDGSRGARQARDQPLVRAEGPGGARRLVEVHSEPLRCREHLQKGDMFTDCRGRVEGYLAHGKLLLPRQQLA